MFNWFVGIIHSRYFLCSLAFGSIEVVTKLLFDDAYLGLSHVFWFANNLIYGVDALLFIYIIVTFFWALKGEGRLPILDYILTLILGFGLYLFANFKLYRLGIVTQTSADAVEGYIFALDFGLFFARVLLILFAILFLLLLYWEFVNKNFFIAELPLLVSLLLWFFCSGLLSFNFLFLFLLMESVTLLVVIIISIYFIFFGARIIKPVIQFFVFNLMVSTFYILGLGLLFFFIPVSSFENLSYLMFVINFWVNYLASSIEPTFLIFIFKLIIWFFLIPFVFKLTLAPFSVWVVQIYSKLPFLFLFLLMGVYKFVYILLFLKLFIYVISSISVFQFSLSTNILLLIIPSMFIGCFAYRATDLKNIIALTTVSQIGYILAACIVQDTSAIKYGLFYIILYMLNLAGIFIIFMIIQKQFFIVNINQLYLIKYYNRHWFYILFFLFASLAGFPPFAGFYLKYFLFLHIYKAGFFGVAFAGLVSGYIMAIIYLQLIIELSMPRHSTENVHQFKSLGTLIDVSSNFLEKRVIQYYINWIFLVLIIFSGFLCLFNLFFLVFIGIVSTFCGFLVYSFVYTIPSVFVDEYAAGTEHWHWFGNWFHLSELKWTSDRSVENVSMTLQTLWKCATLDLLNLDKLLVYSSVRPKHTSYDFFINGQHYSVPIPENVGTAASWVILSNRNAPSFMDDNYDIPFQQLWYIDVEAKNLKYVNYISNKILIQTFSFEDYVNIIDRISPEAKRIFHINSDFDFERYYNNDARPLLGNAIGYHDQIQSHYRGYFEFILNDVEGYYPIDPELWSHSLSYSLGDRNRTRQLQGTVNTPSMQKSADTDGYWLGANVAPPGPVNSFYDTIESDRRVIEMLVKYSHR